jgi:hypothetical protein
LSTIVPTLPGGLPPLSPVGLSVGAPGSGEERLVLQALLRSAAQHGVDWVLSDLGDGSGAAQRRLGTALARIDRAERPLVIARVGKVWDLSRPGARPSRILLPGVLRRSVEASLERLGIERLDALLLDGPDEMGVPLETSWATMLELRATGLAGSIGLAGYSRDVAERCEAVGRVDVTALDLPSQRQLLPALGDWAAAGGPPVLSRLPLPHAEAISPGPSAAAATLPPSSVSPAAPTADSTSAATSQRGERVIEHVLQAGSTAVAIAVSSPRHLLPLLERMAEARAEVA